MIIGWSTPHPSLIEGGNAKEGKLSKMEQLEILCQVGYNKGRWLSFVTAVKGGEGLGVSINAKGEDC